MTTRTGFGDWCRLVVRKVLGFPSSMMLGKSLFLARRMFQIGTSTKPGTFPIKGRPRRRSSQAGARTTFGNTYPFPELLPSSGSGPFRCCNTTLPHQARLVTPGSQSNKRSEVMGDSQQPEAARRDARGTSDDTAL